jgi:type IV pilus assembly protein PilM
VRRKSSILRWLVDPEPPGLGLDLRAGELALARLTGKRGTGMLDACLTAPIASGVLSFSMLEPNVLDEGELQRVVESALVRAGAAGARRIALTLPDHVARISVVELPGAPGSQAELEELLKFRLKKSLPFDVASARLAYERLPGPATTFLTGVMHESVVSQYEELFSDMGFHLGLIKPASVSLLGLLRPIAYRELAPGDDYFFVNVERDYFTVSLVRDREVPVLLRTLGQRSGDSELAIYDEEDLLQEIIPTAIYYREKLAGSSLARIYYRSLRPDLTHLRELLEGQFEAPSEPFHLEKALAVTKNLQMDAPLADAVGAAAGAALGKVA